MISSFILVQFIFLVEAAVLFDYQTIVALLYDATLLRLRVVLQIAVDEKRRHKFAPNFSWAICRRNLLAQKIRKNAKNSET